jgi:hypothetical protein
MPALLCSRIGPGMRPDERTVEVKDIHGRRESLRVPFGYLEVVGDAYYVPCGLVQVDPIQQLAWIELPQEGDCGTSRLLVRMADLLPPLEGWE